MSPSSSIARPIVVGTRGSALALRQTDEVLDRLHQAGLQVQVTVKTIRTSGDRDQRSSLSAIGGDGVFAKELELALLRGEVDLAVHSLKDLPPALAPGLVLAAVPPRADPRDALISRDRRPLVALPPSARVGTGSARRRALLNRARPDLEIVDLRGNVETRIAKVRGGELHAVVLAAAGLHRLGILDEAAELLSVETMTPAPGQGALAIEARQNDGFARSVAEALDDAASHACADAERAFLGRLGSGCSLPVAAYATVEGGKITVRGLIATADGSAFAEARERGPVDRAEAIGTALADALTARGGRPLA